MPGDSRQSCLVNEDLAWAWVDLDHSSASGSTGKGLGFSGFEADGSSYSCINGVVFS
jgi:hypothetical protein